MRPEFVICFPASGCLSRKRNGARAILNSIASSETTIVVEQVADGPLSIENAMDEYLALPNVLKFILARQDEYDAIILGCAGDAGIEGAREQAKVPIVGPGESSLLLGTCGDKYFSMITVSQERAAIKRRMVRRRRLGPPPPGLQPHQRNPGDGDGERPAKDPKGRGQVPQGGQG